jgi:hypothetical protein
MRRRRIGQAEWVKMAGVARFLALCEAKREPIVRPDGAPDQKLTRRQTQNWLTLCR